MNLIDILLLFTNFLKFIIMVLMKKNATVASELKSELKPFRFGRVSDPLPDKVMQKVIGGYSMGCSLPFGQCEGSCLADGALGECKKYFYGPYLDYMCICLPIEY